jgi:hypothetical protein
MAGENQPPSPNSIALTLKVKDQVLRDDCHLKARAKAKLCFTTLHAPLHDSLIIPHYSSTAAIPPLLLACHSVQFCQSCRPCCFLTSKPVQ